MLCVSQDNLIRLFCGCIVLLTLDNSSQAYHYTFRSNQRIVANGNHNQHLLPSFPCALNVTEQSKMTFLKLINQQNKKFIYITLNFTESIKVIPHYKDVLQLKKWIWVEKYAGKPLLELDFRFLAYSVYTLSHDVGWTSLEVTSEPLNCINRLDTEEKIAIILLFLKSTLGEIQDPALKSSACYSRVVPYPSSPTWYHIQYKCCDISIPGKYDMLTSDKYDHIGGDSDKTFITILYVVLFLLSPLLISLLPEEPQIYKVKSDGSAARARYRSSFYEPKKPQKRFPSCGSPDTNFTQSPENSINDSCTPSDRSPPNKDPSPTVVVAMQQSVDSTLSYQSSLTSVPVPLAVSEASLSADSSPTAGVSGTQHMINTLPYIDSETPAREIKDKKSNTIPTRSVNPSNINIRKKDTVVIIENNETSLSLQTPIIRSLSNSPNCNNDRRNISSENTDHQSSSRNKHNEDLYIALDSSTPVRLSHPFRYLFLLHINNEWVCRFRRVNFFLFLYPFIIHIMVTVDIMIYYNEVQFLNKVEKTMKIEGKLTDLDLFDYFWLGNIFISPPLIVFSVEMFMYFVMTIILAVEGNLPKILSQLMTNTNTLGYINLPPCLHTTPTEARGFHLLYHKMKFRLTLMAEPKFWLHWFQELKVIFKLSCTKFSPLTFCKLPMKVLLHIFSLLLLFPLFNCFPWYIITCQMADVAQSAEAAQRCMKRYHHKRFSKLMCIFLIFQIIGIGLIFALKMFMKMCKIMTLFVLYTMKGIVKHYMHTLPAITVLAVSLYYFISTTNKLENKYLEAKKFIYDECILRHEELEEKGRYKQSNSMPLVIFRKDGIPLVPKNLYDLIIKKHLPLKDYELPALAKLCLIATFLVYVATTINAFSISNATSVGQALATFCAVTLPKMFDCFNSRNNIDEDCLKYRIQTTIWNYYDELLEANTVSHAAIQAGSSNEN